MGEKPLSAEYTVGMGLGVSDRLTEIREYLSGPGLVNETSANNYEELADIRLQNLNKVQSYLRGLTTLITTSGYDGNQRIWLDSPKSFFFRHDSGYHGAMIFHDEKWSIHT